MLKRFVALAMVLVMVLGLGLVAYAAVQDPTCGHNSVTRREDTHYEVINMDRHRIYKDVLITCNVCGAQTSGREISEGYHNDYSSYNYHINATQQLVFTKKCSKCGCVIETITKLCSGSPHVTSPW